MKLAKMAMKEQETGKILVELESIGEEAGFDLSLTRPFGFFFGEGEERAALTDITDGGEVAVELHLTKAGDEVFADGTAAVTVTLRCGRCLAEFAQLIETEINAPFFPHLPADSEKDEDEQDEGDVNYHDGERLDVFPVVRDQLILALPLKPLCKEDCKGLCAGCGADLNTQKCGCPKGTPGSPFEALKKLKERL